MLTFSLAGRFIGPLVFSNAYFFYFFAFFVYLVYINI